ncbi:putative Mce family protein [Mycolicibacterium chitae]|uniref:Mce related protein n=1 Tax=Mycolicibacterium chitae TaxID=1792 RepID=A0A448IAG3_MYCCI|nr:MlaD family protein [Mycolicibacterium chitae]MCV7106814.1 MCE family protein [Mycolicibacterium chitae]BBZ00587.1 putative Mce family protein [Mycolicibacterium chitae]VEG49436.1 Mce related protein [Mycolicibacterium chitae]
MNLSGLFEPVAAAAIRAVRFASSRRLLLSIVGQLTLVAVGVAYLAFGALRVNPFDTQMAVQVQLDESGGLLASQDVTLRGIPVGRVQSVEVTGDGVLATALIDGDVRIPLADTAVRVSALSPAGEQYLDFSPRGSDGPFIEDGTIIGRDRTETPVPLWRLLTNVDGVLAQADPAQISAVIDELGVSEQGPEKLRDLFNGAQMLLSTLDGVLPQTMTLLRSSRTVFRILDESSAGLHAMAANLGGTLQGIGAKDAGIRQLLDQTPQVLTTVDKVIADNSPTMVQLLGDLTTVAELSYVRVPALDRMFNDERPPLLDGIRSLMHDGAIWAIADIYPRPLCDYPHPRDVPFIPNYPEPYLYTYCQNDDPNLLVRGARNAPRPPGDDTAVPPEGLDTLRRADPTPITDHTIRTPYGGPVLPPESQPIRQGGRY